MVVLGPGPWDYILSDMEGEVEKDHDIIAWDLAESAVIVRLHLFAAPQKQGPTRVVSAQQAAARGTTKGQLHRSALSSSRSCRRRPCS